jgi:tRNA dimethylallyltransferase
MVQNGWVEEVRRLMGEGIPKTAPGLRAIGYRALYEHLEGIMALNAALEGINTETRQYAKRQRTWLRTEPNLRVLEGEPTTEHAIEMALKIVEAPT